MLGSLLCAFPCWCADHTQRATPPSRLYMKEVMLRVVCAAIGLVVLSLAITGVVKTGNGVVHGTDSPTNVQRNITSEFSEAGFVVPAEGGQSRQLHGQDQTGPILGR